MNPSNKVVFGATSGSTYSMNHNPNFGYATGEYIVPPTTVYKAESATLNGSPTFNLKTTFPNRDVSPATHYIPQSYSQTGNYYSQPASTSTYGTYQEINRPGPAKVSFGGKQYGQVYNLNTASSVYVPPVPTLHTYQTFSQPTEIPIVTSHPIKQQERYEHTKQTKVEAVHDSYVKAPEFTTYTQKKKQKKKGGCPKWIWYLLGALIIIGLIVGLVFLFKHLNAGGTASLTSNKPTTETTKNNTSPTTTTTNTTTTPIATPTSIPTNPSNTSTTLNPTTGTTEIINPQDQFQPVFDLSTSPTTTNTKTNATTFAGSQASGITYPTLNPNSASSQAQTVTSPTFTTGSVPPSDLQPSPAFEFEPMSMEPSTVNQA